MATKVLVLFLAVACVVTAQQHGRKATLRQGAAQTAAQRQFQQLQIALQLPPGTQIHQGSNPPPAQPGMVWIQVPTQGSYPQQPQQPGNYPGNYPQQPGTYPQQPQQPGNYPGGYPQQPQQPGTYPQQPQQPQQPPVQVGGDTLQPSGPGAYPPPSYPAPVPPYPGNQPIRPDSDPEANPDPVEGLTEETGEPGLSPGQETGVGGGGSWEVPEGQGPGTGEVTQTPSPLLVYCKAPRGQFPSATCNTFINCWDDNVVEQQCPGGTVFNELGFCDYPENVDCSNRGVDGASPPSVGGGMEENAACPTPYGAYRSSTSCGIFYVCSAGTPNRFECPEGLNYNTELGVCDYPYRVDCGGTPSERPAPEIPNPEAPNPDENGGGEFIPDPSESHKYYGGLKKIPANMVDSRVPCRTNAVFRLNPSCSSVSLCRNGYSTVINCSTGTAWDSRAQKCLNVYQARC